MQPFHAETALQALAGQLLVRILRAHRLLHHGDVLGCQTGRRRAQRNARPGAGTPTVSEAVGEAAQLV
jgi:hypothetical protein